MMQDDRDTLATEDRDEPVEVTPTEARQGTGPRAMLVDRIAVHRRRRGKRPAGLLLFLGQLSTRRAVARPRLTIRRIRQLENQFMSKRAAFAVEAATNPTRYFKRPRQVVDDRRLAREEKLAVLQAWELEARSLAVASEERMSGGEPSLLQDVVEARLALGAQTEPTKDTGAPTKHGMRQAKLS